jgi:4-amino-4-deoxy-L-arabinose transferase-like glycosyltransferase
MTLIKKYFDFAILALIVSVFVLVAAQRLGDVPVPDTDEAMTLQVPYEILHRDKLAFPMYQFLGGNIENAWHSFTPVYFVTLSGFMKMFGWGLTQGRTFNLITAVLVLLMLYLIARNLFGWQVGLIAIVLMISDPVFLARSRLVRNDLLAAAFGLLAFYLYEKAEKRGRTWYYAVSGLSAGGGIMCHTNLLYMPCVIAALMLLTRGWKILKTGKPYLFAGGMLAAMAYEIAYDIIDYRNFMLQNRSDDVHFRVLQPLGWLNNLLAEPARYVQWFNGRGAKIPPQTALLHLFLSLTILAIIYLIVRSLIQLKRGSAMSEHRVRVLAATVIVSLFFAIVAQRKVTQYVVNLAPWFAVCVAVLVTDGVTQMRRLRELRWRFAKPAYGAAILIVALVVGGYAYELLGQNRSYLASVRDPDRASLDEFKAALRSTVPDGLCPVSVASGYLWLAFPEQDQCYFAYMEARLDEPLDLKGRDYALIIHPKFENRLRRLTGAGFEKYHLLGELQKTAYGSFRVYYTGSDPRFVASAPKRYYFFGRRRGYVSDEQVAAGREVWKAEYPKLTPNSSSGGLVAEPDDPDDQEQPEETPRGKLVDLCSVELEANMVYQLSADASCRGECELIVADGGTGKIIQRIQPGELEGRQLLEGLFKTSSGKRITLAIRFSGREADTPVISRMSIREIAAL